MLYFLHLGRPFCEEIRQAFLMLLNIKLIFFAHQDAKLVTILYLKNCLCMKINSVLISGTSMLSLVMTANRHNNRKEHKTYTRLQFKHC